MLEEVIKFQEQTRLKLILEQINVFMLTNRFGLPQGLGKVLRTIALSVGEFAKRLKIFKPDFYLSSNSAL